MKDEVILEKNVPGRIDHTLLKAEAAREQILRLCDRMLISEIVANRK